MDTFDDSSVVVRSPVIEAADDVAKVILEAAAHGHADLIALGAHAKTGVSRLVLVSVSEEVRPPPMPTWIGVEIGAGVVPAEYAVMHRRRTACAWTT